MVIDGQLVTPACGLHRVLRGIFQRKLLEDEAILSDHNIKDDAILYLQLQMGAARVMNVIEIAS